MVPRAVYGRATLVALVATLTIFAPSAAQVGVSQAPSGGATIGISQAPSGVSNSNVAPMPMQSFEAPAKSSEVPSRGLNIGTQPNAAQCGNLLRRAASVPSLKQSPDYAFCDALPK